MDDMLKDFVVEALDLAVNVEEYLLKLEKAPDDKDALNAVFRSFHTIKGGAGFMNIGPMVSACHLTENLFDALRNGKAPVTQLAIDAALEASGFVADQLNQLADGEEVESLQPLPPQLEKRLMEAIEGSASAAIAATAAASVPAVSIPSATPATASALPMQQGAVDWETYYRALLPADVRAALPEPAGATVATVVEAAPASAAAASAAAPVAAPAKPARTAKEGGEEKGAAKEESIRIDSGKLDVLLEVAGESVQATNQASVLLEKLMQHSFEEAAADIMKKLEETLSRASRYSTELQHATLSARMQPVGRLFQKFPRLVRELARDLGKEVELVIEGAETEVDRVVVESLYDPLVHMLRNSLDHAIEEAEARKAVNKPGRAVILLKAWQAGNSIMIELADDGRGIDANAIRAKAVSKGLIPENAELTEEESLKLIFLPGFSTKEVANSVSGRGVGMDVVKTAVEKHRGVINIHSQLGKGTRFLIQLPIEMSIVPTMLLKTAGALLGIPMSLVERVVELPDEMKGVRGNPVFMDQGRPLPVHSLAAVLGYVPGEESLGVVVNAPSPYILAVDGVDGTADLVIKPLTSLNAKGMTGTSRSAEGDLVLIISIAFLLSGCR
jgi:two-component system chemotaxis sensor kinase CheA